MTVPSADTLGVVQVHYDHVVTSTMDIAHRLGVDGAPGGTLVIADEQTQGRGRSGRRWASHELDGIYMTLLERPASSAGLELLSIRVGLALASSLENHLDSADGPLQLKWPNDVLTARGKLAGILVEARWREGELEWVAIGVGINLRVPVDMPNACALRAGTARNAVLCEVVPRIRVASTRRDQLSLDELRAWNVRDFSFGKRVHEPVRGVAEGIASDGALLVRADDGVLRHVRSGSLVLA